MAQYLTIEDRMQRLAEGPGGSPVAALQQQVESAMTFVEEPGLLDTDKKQRIKLCADGSIDIFVDGDVGIHIDPASATINLYGRPQHHASAIREWIAEDKITEVKQAWIVRCEGKVEVEGRTVLVKGAQDVTVESAGTATIKAARDIRVEGSQQIAVDARSHITVHAAGNLTVTTDQDLTLSAGRNVKVKAGGFIDFE